MVIKVPDVVDSSRRGGRIWQFFRLRAAGQNWPARQDPCKDDLRRSIVNLNACLARPASVSGVSVRRSPRDELHAPNAEWSAR